MVFPLLITVLFWDRFELSRRYAGLPGLPRIRLGRRQLPWPDAAAAAMFLAIGGLALYIAYTGQSTYLPDWLLEWNRWATGVAGDPAAALSLRGMPAAAQATLLAVLAAGVGWALYRAWRLDPKPQSASDRNSSAKDRAVSRR
jgi:hypothetical protein